jgi:hypothetical protein
MTSFQPPSPSAARTQDGRGLLVSVAFRQQIIYTQIAAKVDAVKSNDCDPLFHKGSREILSFTVTVKPPAFEDLNAAMLSAAR